MHVFDSKIYRSSLMRAISENETLSALTGKNILITGSTGMVGSCLVDMLFCLNEVNKAKNHIFALNRTISSAKKRFSYCKSNEFVHFLDGDVSGTLCNLPDNVDYIIHTASNADPVRISINPVETLLTNIVGTQNLIEYGMTHGMKRFLFVSSGEMYGQPDKDLSDFVEDYCGPIDHSLPRSCYPVGKRAAEVLCQSYISQHNVDAVIVRPCHIFGPTMKLSDSRAVSEFFRCAIEERSITMKSAGLLERSHCYSIDAVNAMLYVILKGKCGEAYNIADKNTQMTIRNFAQNIANISGAKISFSNPSDIEAKGYSTSKRMVLSSEKLKSLGWKTLYPGIEAIEETYFILKEILG